MTTTRNCQVQTYHEKQIKLIAIVSSAKNRPITKTIAISNIPDSLNNLNQPLYLIYGKIKAEV